MTTAWPLPTSTVVEAAGSIGALRGDQPPSRRPGPVHRRADARTARWTAMLAAAHAAPSVGLTQPWDFVLVTNESRRQAPSTSTSSTSAAFRQSLPARRRSGSPTSRSTGSSNRPCRWWSPTTRPGRPHVLGRHAIADAGLYSVCLAIENLWLAATAEGWAWVGSPSTASRSCARLLGIPEIGPARGLAVRRTGHPPRRPVPDLVRHGWRDRLPLSEVVHHECWSASGGCGRHRHGMDPG